MARWSNKTMEAIATLVGSVDGAYSLLLRKHEGAKPRGKRQDYDGPEVPGIRDEWVDQNGGGISGDDFHGTVSFVLGDYHLIVAFHS